MCRVVDARGRCEENFHTRLNLRLGSKLVAELLGSEKVDISVRVD